MWTKRFPSATSLSPFIFFFSFFSFIFACEPKRRARALLLQTIMQEDRRRCEVTRLVFSEIPWLKGVQLVFLAAGDHYRPATVSQSYFARQIISPSSPSNTRSRSFSAIHFPFFFFFLSCFHREMSRVARRQAYVRFSTFRERIICFSIREGRGSSIGRSSFREHTWPISFRERDLALVHRTSARKNSTRHETRVSRMENSSLMNTDVPASNSMFRNIVRRTSRTKIFTRKCLSFLNLTSR